MRATLWAALLTCALVPLAHSEPAALTTVGVAIADKRPIAKTIDFVGRVEAINRVDVRARVKGYLDAVAEIAAAPVIEKYTGVLGAADVFTVPTAFSILASIRLDLGYRMDIHP